VRLTGGQLRLFDGSSIDNHGLWDMTGNSMIDVRPLMRFRDGSVFINEATGTFDAQSNANLTAGRVLLLLDQTGGALFDNRGSFRLLDGGTAIKEARIAFDNSGSLEVQGRELELRGPGTHSGSFTGAGALGFAAPNLTNELTPSSSVTVNDVRIRERFVQIHGTYDVPGSTVVSNAGNVTFHPDATVLGLGETFVITFGGLVDLSNGEPVTVTNFTQILSSSVLTGDTDLTVTGSFTWTGGTMTDSSPGPAGSVKTIVAPTATVLINGRGSFGTRRLFGGRRLELGGSGSWVDGGVLRLRDGSVLAVSGTLDVFGRPGIIDDRPSAVGFVENSGTLRHIGTGTFSILSAFDNSPDGNDGTIDVQDGGRVELTNTFSNYDASTKTLSGGNYHVHGSGVFEAVGLDVEINDAGILLDGAGQLVNQFNNAALVDLRKNTANGSLTLDGGRNLTVSNFVNEGSLTLGADSTFTTGPDVTITESGWRLKTPIEFSDPQSAHYNPIDGRLYVNRDTSGGGLHRIEADGSATLISSASNLGGVVIDPDDGDLLVIDNGGGRLVRVNPVTGAVSNVVTGLNLPAPTLAGVDITPDGSRIFITERGANRILTLTRDSSETDLAGYAQTATGSLSIELGGTSPGVDHSRLEVNGTAQLDGTLNVSLTGGFAAQTGDRFDVIGFDDRLCDFHTKTGLDLGGGLFLAAEFGADTMTLAAGDTPDFGQQCGTFGIDLDPAKAGETVTITFASAETLSGPSPLTVDGNVATFVSSNASLFTFEYVVAGTETEGLVDVVASGTNAGGSPFSEQTIMTLDFTAPVLTSLIAVPDPVTVGLGLP
jgi:hypothetical protein